MHKNTNTTVMIFEGVCVCVQETAHEGKWLFQIHKLLPKHYKWATHTKSHKKLTPM